MPGSARCMHMSFLPLVAPLQSPGKVPSCMLVVADVLMHAQGFVRFYTSGPSRVDVEMLNDQMRPAGALRLRHAQVTAAVQMTIALQHATSHALLNSAACVYLITVLSSLHHSVHSVL